MDGVSLLFLAYVLHFFRLWDIISLSEERKMIKHYTKLQKVPEIGISVLEKTIYGEYPTHWHDFTEMEFILSGGGKYIIDGKQHEIRENMLFL